MKILVTGGAGFIGKHLVRSLIHQGYEILVIDRKPADHFFSTTEFATAGVQYLSYDIRNKACDSAILNFAPETVYHLAADILDRASELDPISTADQNILGTLRIFEAAKHAGAKTFVFASSSAVYGSSHTLPYQETHLPNPLTPYGITKLCGEFFLNRYRRFGITTHALRFANVYGPGQDASAESGAVAIFTHLLLNNQTALINNDGLTTRDYVYVKDIVEGLIKASAHRESGVWNLGTGIETTTIDLFQQLRSLTQSAIDPTFSPSIMDAVKRSCLDSHSATTAFAWAPTTSLETGLTATIDWYRQNPKNPSSFQA